MIKNYFTIAVRNVRRNLGYTAINVFGLALGITCSLILFLLIQFFTSFDKNHPAGDRIYRITSVRENNGQYDYQPGVPSVLPNAVRSDITGLDDVLFVSYQAGALIAVEQDGSKKMISEEGGIAFTDSHFFNFFNRQIISGSVGSFDKPNEGILSRSWAEKYFGSTDVLGKVMTLDNTHNIVIVAVMDDVPGNTNFPFDLIISYKTVSEEKEAQGWYSIYSDDQCFVLLGEQTLAQNVVSQFDGFITKYMGNEAAEKMTINLQPLDDLMFNDRYGNYNYRTITRESLWAMGIVGVFLLLTACINFINLSTAVAVKRSKEVGIRKVMGSQRGQLMFQYFCETGIITLISLLVSVGLAEIGLIQLNVFFETDLHIQLASLNQWTFLGIVWVVVSLTSGLYPALLLSGFSPAKALKSKMTQAGSGGYSLRRVLVVFQFVISQVLIVGTVIMLSQMSYFAEKDLGFSRDAIITVPLFDVENISSKQVLKKEIDRLGGVQQSTLNLTPPSSSSTYNTHITLEGASDQRYRVQLKKADGEYLKMFDIPVVAGRGLADLDTASGWIVNEKLCEVVGYTNPEDILGRAIKMGRRTLPVIGVVRNFHTVSLNDEIYPTMLFNDLADYQNISIRLKGGQFSATIKEIEDLWTSQYPDYLFSYEFLDEAIREFYEREQRLSGLLIIFSAIAIIIGCLGLYGLVSYMANEKEKEIGVRKVLGASTNQILYIFSRELTLLVIVSFIIAAPLAGYVMNGWLQNFAYHVEITWFMFGTGVMVTFFIALATVSYRSVRASVANPIDALRNE